MNSKAPEKIHMKAALLRGLPHIILTMYRPSLGDKYPHLFSAV
jgi:hypothetical protein